MPATDGSETWIRTRFQLWLDELTPEQRGALVENWDNIMDDAALERVNSWIIAGRAIAELRRGHD